MKKKLSTILICTAVCFTLAALTMSFQDSSKTVQKQQTIIDTLPKEKDIEININSEDIDKIIKKSMEAVDKSLQAIDWNKISGEVQQSLQKIDWNKIQMDIDRSMKSIDWQKIKNDVDNAMKNVDENKIKAEVNKAMEEARNNIHSQINLHQMQKENLEEIKKEMEHLKNEMKKEKEEYKLEMKKAKEEMKREKETEL